MELLEKWICECLGALIKEPTEENRKIVAKTIASEIEDREKGTKIGNRIIGLKQKAIDFVDRINKECDGGYWFNKYPLTDLLVMFATENGIKWHDIQEDPNDLPKEDCETVTLHENGNKNIIKWRNGEWNNAIVIPVIAWFEIPHFEE